MGIDAVVVLVGAFVGGVAVLAACWRMLAHYDRMNRQEHVALMEAIRGVAERTAVVETKMEAVEGRMTALETRMTALEGRMTALEDRMTALEGKMTALVGRMTAVEGKLDLLIAQQQPA